MALFVLCALLALGDAFPSATSAASSTAVLPPAGEVVELTVRKGRKKRKRKKNEIPRWSIGVEIHLNLLCKKNKRAQDDNFDALIRADTHTDWLVAIVVRSSSIVPLLLLACFSFFEKKKLKTSPKQNSTISKGSVVLPLPPARAHLEGPGETPRRRGRQRGRQEAAQGHRRPRAPRRVW